ncbi:MAG: hypothetical protein GX942_03960 [Papillibacter sp.]|nr:hypothetical protein [Papillibacter sp.]
MTKKIITLVLCLIMSLTLITNVAAAAINVEAPQNLTVEVKTEADGYPYFQLSMQVPASVKALHEAAAETDSLIVKPLLRNIKRSARVIL